MKKTIFLAICAISLFVGSPCFSQDQEEEQSGDELNRVTLSTKESKECLDTLESAWTKVKNLPKNLAWGFGDFVRTMGKIASDPITGNKIYVLTIDKKAHFDDGSIISSLKFEVFANDQKKHAYFPLETLTFYYNHTIKKGIVVYLVENFYDDPVFHEKSPREIRGKIKELMRSINELFI